MTRRKTLLLRLGLLAFSCVVGFLAVELGLRWMERRATQALLANEAEADFISSEIPGLYYTLKPGAKAKSYSINNLGFNMPERPVEKPPGHWRIMVVGDSFTQGVGASTQEDAYPNKTEYLLRERLKNKKLEVWNCGAGGYNVDQAHLMLRHIVTNYSPNAVIYGFCFNDYWGPSFFLSGQAAQPLGAGGSEGRRVGLLDQLKQLRTVVAAKQMYDRLHYSTKGYLPVFVDKKISYPSWQAMKKRIVEMRDFCQARQWPFAVCIVPMPQFLFEADEKNRALQDLKSSLEKENIPYVDSTVILRSHRNEELFVEFDNHPNSAGYDLIAQSLCDWLIRQGPPFVPPSEPDSVSRP